MKMTMTIELTSHGSTLLKDASAPLKDTSNSIVFDVHLASTASSDGSILHSPH
jgi:hypothetical protein